MRFRIRHDTLLSYSSPVKSVIMVLRLTPRSHEGQHVASWRIDLDIDCLVTNSEDAFGNIVHTFNIDGPLRRVGVVAEGEVETFDTAGIMRGSLERFPPQFYLRETRLTAANAHLRAFASDVAAVRDGTLDVLHGLMSALHETLSFDQDSAGVGTTAAEALAAKGGDSRDFAHIFVACARHLDIPARYVNGFFMHPDGGIEQKTSHAWAEAFVPDIGWIGFDPVNDVCPQEAHVRVGYGLDYLGAAPVRAACSGGTGELPVMTVRVDQKQGKHQSQAQKQS
jgi:transglutaminase-like putative cysteine protease